MNNNSRALPIIVAVLALCCILEALFSVAAISYFSFAQEEPAEIVLLPTDPPSPTLPRTRIAPTALPTPSLTRTLPPATFTPTIRPPTPIRVTPSPTVPASGGGLYDVFLPVPTAPPMAYPVEFKSATTVVTYSVSGKTLNAISNSLETSALADPHEPGSRYYARTNWFVQGQWSWKPTARGCEVNSGTVSVAITITLPALLNSAAVPAEVVTRWNTFIRNTSFHEQGHGKLALQGARDYQNHLANYPPASNCDLLQDQLRDLYNRDFEAIDRVNIKYDKDTDHGLTQGAVFP